MQISIVIRPTIAFEDSYLKVKLLLDAEFRQLNGHRFRFHAREEILEDFDGQFIFQLVKAAEAYFFNGNQDEHTKILSLDRRKAVIQVQRSKSNASHLVRNADHLGAQIGALDVSNLGHGEHRRYGDDFARRHEKVQWFRGFGRERIRPVSIEVDGVGDDELRVGREARQNVADSALRLAGYPPIDRGTGRLRVAGDVQLGHFAQVKITGLPSIQFTSQYSK